MKQLVNMSTIFGGTFALLAGLSLLVPSARAADLADLPEGPIKDLWIATCTVCHSTDRILAAKYNRKAWIDTVNRMRRRGAEGSSDEIDAIADFLATNLGLPDKVNPNKATPEQISTVLAVTPKEAQAIVDYRAAHGDFKTWQDLQKVDGVDAKKIEAAKDNLEF